MASKKNIKVLKFGGTSMGSAVAMRKVISIIKQSRAASAKASSSTKASAGQAGVPRAVVVSAMSGVTDHLIKIATLSAAKDRSYKKLFAELEARHIRTVKALIGPRHRAQALLQVKTLLSYLHDVVRSVYLVGELSPGALDHIMSYGERLSARMLAEALSDRGVPSEYLNARNVVVTDDNFGEAAVDFTATNRNIRNYFRKHPKLQVVTGFIGATPDKNTTTLGRGGSDYSAAIFGAALSARVIEIWTDVSGVMTADPRKVTDTLPIASMTYQEAVEMSYFGAKVIHPPTMRPAEEKGIPLLIKNTFVPAAPGTIIGKKATSNGALAKGISSVSCVTMLRVEGSGMLRMRGASGRLFSALSRARVNAIIITQASSQNSISFGVAAKDTDRACRAIDEEFREEHKERLIDETVVARDLSIVAVVGEGMQHRIGTAGRLFHTLARNGINVVAIAQGSSELNISVVIAKGDEEKALNALHTAFFFPEEKIVNIFLVGTGLIGSTLLAQIARQRAYLEREHNFSIRVVGIANAHRMSFEEKGIEPDQWEKTLAASKTKVSLPKFIEMMKRGSFTGKVFVDCTRSDEVAKAYADILASNISIVTPNKKANSGSYAYYKELQGLVQKKGAKFLYETNAGAALPIIGTLKDLLLSGDKILKIEGVLSGTLGYVFNAFVGDRKFSEVVRKVRELGFSETDPRADLDGTDAARKILILARECGIPLELADVRVESFVSPASARAKSAEAFFDRLKKEDAFFEKKKRAAEKSGKRLRYIATLERGRATVKLRAVAPTHPFYDLSGSDNIVAFTTARYKHTPLVVKGPGAGAEVTAAGVFADILRTARGVF